MEFAFFEVNSKDPATGLAQLNAYVQSHKIQEIDKYVLRCNGYLCVYYTVTSLGSKNPANSTSTGSVTSDSSQTGQSNDSEKIIDYMLALTDQEFSVYRTLRERREELATDRGDSKYTLCLNYSLACAVASRVQNVTQLTNIHGIGPATVRDFGGVILEEIKKALESGQLDPTPRALPSEEELKKLYGQTRQFPRTKGKGKKSKSPTKDATNDATGDSKSTDATPTSAEASL